MIQQDGQGAVQMPQQLAEKEGNLLLPDLIDVELTVKAQALTSRTYRNPGNN